MIRILISSTLILGPFHVIPSSSNPFHVVAGRSAVPKKTIRQEFDLKGGAEHKGDFGARREVPRAEGR